MMAEYLEREAAKVLFEKYGATEDAIALIDSIPSTDVAHVRQGRWVDTGFENSTGNIYKCSLCKGFWNPSKTAIFCLRQTEKPNYCPNCGAKMDLE